MKILMVLTSHDQMGDTGHKTGFWLEEFTAPYYVFRDAGADITIASPKGGQPPVDPNSEAEEALTETIMQIYRSGEYPSDNGPDDGTRYEAVRQFVESSPFLKRHFL